MFLNNSCLTYSIPTLPNLPYPNEPYPVLQGLSGAANSQYLTLSALLSGGSTTTVRDKAAAALQVRGCGGVVWLYIFDV